MDIRKNPNLCPNLRFDSTCYVVVGHRKVEGMVSTRVVPTMKHGGGGVIVWGCFADDIVADLLKIQGTGSKGGRVIRAHAINAADPGSIPTGGPLLHVTSPSLSHISYLSTA